MRLKKQQEQEVQSQGSRRQPQAMNGLGQETIEGRSLPRKTRSGKRGNPGAGSLRSRSALERTTPEQHERRLHGPVGLGSLGDAFSRRTGNKHDRKRARKVPGRRRRLDRLRKGRVEEEEEEALDRFSATTPTRTTTTCIRTTRTLWSRPRLSNRPNSE